MKVFKSALEAVTWIQSNASGPVEVIVAGIGLVHGTNKNKRSEWFFGPSFFTDAPFLQA